MPRPRKVAAAAAVGGGLTLTGLYGFLFGEALLARRAIGTTDARPPTPDGVYGDDLPGRTIRLAVLGDSAAVGYGMERADQTPPAMLGYGLAHILGSPVEVRSYAVVGARTVDILDDQLDRLGDYEPDVSVIVIGINDITHQIPGYVSARQLGQVIDRLVAMDSEVVVGTTPDLGTVKPIKQPLRWVARGMSRSLARRQAVVTIAHGGRAVSLGSLLAHLFSERHDVMFGLDKFHPSEAGYAHMVSVLMPAVAASIGGREAHDAARRVVTPARRWNQVLRRRNRVA